MARELEGPVERAGCELGAVERWMATAPPRASLALAVRGRRTMVALAHEGELLARATDGGLQRARFDGARSLVGIEAIGDRFVVLARGSCERAAHCVMARVLGPRGEAGDSIASAELPEPPRTFRRAVAGDAVLFAWSTTAGHRALDRFSVADSAVAHARVELGTEPASTEAPVEILALATEADRWAVVWRRGVTEDPRSEVYLTTPGAHGPAEAMHHALVVDSAELAGDDLSVIATFEYSRPHFVRLRASEPDPIEARELAAGAAAPAPFHDRTRAELDADSRGLWLRRRDAAGYPIGPRVLVVEGAVSSGALAREGDEISVAWIASSSVLLRRARCR